MDMDLRAELDRIETDPGGARVFGRPYDTADGTTVIPVAEVRARGDRSRARPAGVFVVKDGRARWVPAVDTTRISLMGILVGLVSATLAGVAMVRRPPWPDLHGDISEHGDRFRR